MAFVDRSRNNYIPIADFGNMVKAPATDYLIKYCLFDDVDKSFNVGPQGYLFGPNSKNCQILSTDYCSQGNNWASPICQILSQNNNMSFPSSSSYTCNGNNNNNHQNPINGNFSNGQNLLRTSVQKKYLNYSGCDYKEYPFDYTDSSSPMIREIVGGNGTCNPSCSTRANYDNLDPKKVDFDPLLNTALANPSICGDTLNKICVTFKVDGRLGDYQGTKLGDYCNKYFNLVGRG